MKRARGSGLLDGLLGLLATAALALLYAPLLTVIALSVFQPVRRRGELGFAPFSLEPYARLALNDDILGALTTTMAVGAIATAASVALGLLFALYHASARGLARQVLQVLIFLPFLLPPIITGLALLIMFRELDLARGFSTVVIGHIVFIVPIVFRTILVRLRALSPSLAEASFDLGASRLQTLRHVILPQLGTALAASAFLAFAVSFDETLITLFLSGSTTTLPIRLWGMMRVGFVPEINALVTLVLVFAALVTIAVALLQRPVRSA